MPQNVLPEMAEKFSFRTQNNHKTLKEWMVKFQETPIHALTWAADAHRAAAELSVYGHALELMKQLHEAGKTHQEIEDAVRSVATTRALSLSSYTNRSSSAHANLMEDHLRAAWARVAKWSEFEL